MRSVVGVQGYQPWTVTAAEQSSRPVHQVVMLRYLTQQQGPSGGKENNILPLSNIFCRPSRKHMVECWTIKRSKGPQRHFRRRHFIRWRPHLSMQIRAKVMPNGKGLNKRWLFIFVQLPIRITDEDWRGKGDGRKNATIHRAWVERFD